MPPDRIDKLQSTLGELREQLDATPELDAETRGQLHESIEEAEAGLRAAREAEEPNWPGSLHDRLTGAIERFEGQHPNLAAAVGRVIDALADLGI